MKEKSGDPDVNVNANIAPKGIDKDDPYTWFEAEKEILPTRMQCRGITVGMHLNEVIVELGKPQRDIGHGASIFQFDVAEAPCSR